MKQKDALSTLSALNAVAGRRGHPFLQLAAWVTVFAFGALCWGALILVIAR